MHSDENPYRPPVDTTVYEARLASKSLLWRKGNILVMHKQSDLPDRCVKSNVPTDRRLKRKLSWHSPWIYLTILISILVYVIIAIVVSKKATIQIGLSDQWFARRRRAILIGWSAVLASFVLPFPLASALDNDELIPAIIIGAFLLFLFGAIFGLVRSRMVVPQRISDDYVWLKGVCPEFLAGLPDWPYTP